MRWQTIVGLVVLAATLLIAHPLYAQNLYAQNKGETLEAKEDRIVHTKVSVHHDRADIVDILKEVFQAAGADYTIDPKVKGTLTVSLNQLPFRVALEVVLKSSEIPLTYTLNNGVYAVILKEQEAAGFGPEDVQRSDAKLAQAVKPAVASGLELKVKFSSKSSRPSDLVLRVTLTNRSARPVKVFPDFQIFQGLNGEFTDLHRHPVRMFKKIHDPMSADPSQFHDLSPRKSITEEIRWSDWYMDSPEDGDDLLFRLHYSAKGVSDEPVEEAEKHEAYSPYVQLAFKDGKINVLAPPRGSNSSPGKQVSSLSSKGDQSPLLASGEIRHLDFLAYRVRSKLILDLQTAVRQEDLDALTRLLKKGLDPNAPDKEGVTPLMVASAVGNLPAIQALLQRGAHINALHPMYGSALVQAILDDHLEIVRYLREHGADLKASTGTVCQLDSYTLGAVFNEPSIVGVAVVSGHLDVLRYLLRIGESVNAAGTDGRTPLMLAAQANQIACFRQLIASHVHIAVRDKWGNTALTYAAEYSPEALPILLRKGALLEEQNDQGETALFSAGKAHTPETVQILLRAHARTDIVDHKGRTALMAVCATNFGDEIVPTLELRLATIVKIMLAAGADRTLKDSKGDTALSLARQFGHEDAVQLLLKNEG